MSRTVKARIAQLQRDYPHPSACEDRERIAASYCVGGALCLAQGKPDQAWPSRYQLYKALRAENPQLTVEKATEWLDMIFRANDTGHFAVAWHFLADALRWRPKTRETV